MNTIWSQITTSEELMEANNMFLRGEIDYSPFYGAYDQGVPYLDFLVDSLIIPMNLQDSSRMTVDNKVYETRTYFNGIVQIGGIMPYLFQFLRSYPDYYCMDTSFLNTFRELPFAQSRSKTKYDREWKEYDFLESTKITDHSMIRGLTPYPNINRLIEKPGGSGFIYFHIAGKYFGSGSVLELLKIFVHDYITKRVVATADMTVDDLLTQYYYVSTKDLWGAIRSYRDLVLVNSTFLEGKLYDTPYYASPLTPDFKSDENSLALVNRLGFLSMNGQPYLHEVGITNYIDKNKENEYYELLQIPYINGILPLEYYPAFVEFMKSQPHFYYSVVSTDKKPKELQNTFPNPREVYPVTTERVAKTERDLASQPWSMFSGTNRYTDHNTGKVIHQSAYYFGEYNNIVSILKGKTVDIEIATSRDFPTASIVDMLLSFLKQMEPYHENANRYILRK